MEEKLKQALNTISAAAQLAPLTWRDHMAWQEAFKIVVEALEAKEGDAK